MLDPYTLTMSRYRWRTELRGRLPNAFLWLAPKGRDCGEHEWYRQDDATDACYHCEAVRASGALELPWDSALATHAAEALAAGKHSEETKPLLEKLAGTRVTSS